MTDAVEDIRQLKRDYQENFGTPQGVRILEDLRGYCGYDKSSFHLGAPDSTAHSEGMRRVILYIHAKIKRDDESLLKQIELQEDN